MSDLARVAASTAMQSRRVVARVPDANDLRAVFDWVNDPRVAHRWRGRGAQVTPNLFQESVSKDTTAHFVGQHVRSGQLVAYATLFGVDLRAGHAQFGLLSDPRFLSTGLAIELGGLVVDYAFDAYPLRKLYLEMPEYNRDPLHGFLDRFATLEAVLPEHVFWGGELHSTLMYSLSRASWLGPAAPVWQQLREPPQALQRLSE